MPKKLIYSMCLFMFLFSQVNAEGSVNLISNGGDRPFIDFSSLVQVGINRKTLIYAFLKQNETLNLGSSANGILAAKITVTTPKNEVLTSVGESGVGVINNNVEEKNGPYPGSGGYTPFKVMASVEGIYKIEFMAPIDDKTVNDVKLLASDPWRRAIDQPKDQAQVLAWDATVTGVNGQKIDGRVYTNSFAGNMRANGRSLSSVFYVLTDQGWQYSINMRAMDPFAFILFANNKGNLSADGKTPAMKSLPASEVKTWNPENLDSIAITHKILLNTPPNPEVSNFRFIGSEGTASATGYNMGGNFLFNTNSSGRNVIRIDINNNGKIDDTKDVILTADMNSGENKIYWDGKDGLGIPVPPGKIDAKSIILEGIYGEIHFPLYDAEGNPKGFTITRLNGPSAPNTDIFWDDRRFSDISSFLSIQDNRAGLASLNGIHAWNGVDRSLKGGDLRVIDTWSYIHPPKIEINAPIEIRSASLQITDHKINSTSVTVGQTFEIGLNILNLGPSDVATTTFYYKFPGEITIVGSPKCDTDYGNYCGSAKVDSDMIVIPVSVLSASKIAVKINLIINSQPTNGSIVNYAGIIRLPDYFDQQATKIIPNGFVQSFDLLKQQCVDSGFVDPLCDNISLLALSNSTTKTKLEVSITPTSTLATTTQIIKNINEKDDAVKNWDELLKKIEKAQEIKVTTAVIKPLYATTTNFFDEYLNTPLTCAPAISRPVNKQSSPNEIANLRKVLSLVFNKDISLTGSYDQALIEEIKKYQSLSLNKLTILHASGVSEPNGLVGKYTMAQLNVDVCMLNKPKRCPYFFDYITLGDKDNTKNLLQESITTQVNVWKEFLNIIFPGTNLVYNGVYDKKMRSAVGKYHTLYKKTILSPWKNANPNADVTYYLREASRNWGNYMVNCSEGPIDLYDGSGSVDYK
jgi:hypothetical protein